MNALKTLTLSLALVMGAARLLDPGISKVIAVAGGIAEWKAQGLPVSA